MTEYRGMMEGLGGPVKMDSYTVEGIDPTLDSCCQREVESNRRLNALDSTLRRHDVVAMAERRRRNLVATQEFEGCRCCYDPNSDGGEYHALAEYKEKHPFQRKDEIEEGNDGSHDELPQYDSSDKDSDDEFDYLLDEDFPQDDTVKELEENRRAELEFQIMSNQAALQHGYGAHRQLHPSRVLKAAGLGDSKARQPPSAVVLHLVDPDSLASASLDYFLESKLAPETKGTIFLRSGGRSTLQLDATLARKSFPKLQPEMDLPALVAIRDGVVVNTAPTLRGLCFDKDSEVDNRAVQDWLDRSGVLLSDAPSYFELCYIRPEEEALMDYLSQAKPEPEVEYYDCGMEGCNKTFFHEHVGIKTSEQDGLVVKEDTILDNSS